jgi:pimeloyl-ACP methyl ester carboxylesterase
MYIFNSLLESFLIIYAITALFLYVAQELIIFPRLVSSRFKRRVLHENRIPAGIESFFAHTADGKDIEIWTTHRKNEEIKVAGIIFHGNGETVETRNYLAFFEKVGIKAFTFDYRGTGLSSGWPSEKGLYLDAEGVYKAVIERTKLSADKIIILGNSIGSGPASYLASKIQPKGLILISAYTDIRSLVKEKIFYRFFAYITRYYLPTSEYLKQLKTSFVILVHGKRDRIIPFHHMEDNKNNIPANIKVCEIVAENYGHNDLYDHIEADMVKKTKEMIAG